jgi:hypothetical protein
LEEREDVEKRLRQDEDDDQFCRKLYEEYKVVDSILDYQEKEIQPAVDMYYDNIDSDQRT